MKPESYLVRAMTGLLPVANKLLVAALLFASAAFQVQAQSYTVSALWSVGNGTANLVNDNNNRGLAYNVISNQVYIAGRSSAAKAISVLDGTSGAVIAADFPNISVLPYNIGVADDGVIYGVPLANGVNANNLNIYAWTNWNSLQRQCYAQVGGDATSLSSVQGQRVGDSFAIYGGGTNTLILLPIDTGTGSRTTNNMLLFSTADGQTFVPKVINISGFPLPFSDAGPEHGVAFVNSSNFLYRPGVGTSTYLISFPANFASLASPVAATVIATNTTLPNGAGSDVYLFSYSPAGKLLADYGQILGSFSSSSATSLALYDISGFPTANIMATTNTPHTVAANGNFTGGVALGGAGKTNAVYVLDSNNGVWAFALTYVGAPPPPTITSQPSGGTGVYVPFNLSVTAVGTGTLGYQWQVTNSAGSGFVNISGANTNIYAVTAAPVTNFYRVIVTNFAGAVTSSVVLVQTLKPVTNSAVASLWRVAAGQSGYSYLTPSSDGTRGIAYDTNSQRVVVASTSGLFVLDGNTGTNIETLSTVGVTFGGLLGGADQVGIADDGAVYVCNVVNAGGQFNLYRWSAPSNSVTATSAYGADPAGGAANGERWGDTMAIRGAGPGTQILLGSRASAPSGTNVALLTPNDGVGLTYSSVIISVSGVPAGFAGYGISFGAGNTFWAKNSGGDLFEIAFDTNALTGTVIFDYKAPSQISGGIVGVAVDPVNSILAGITDNDSPHDVQLFQLTGTTDSPLLFNQSFFAAANANGNGNAVVTIKYPRVYALDVDNGIVALTYGVPSTTPAGISTPPASVTAYTNIATVTFSVGASGSLPLFYQWRFNSNNISGATSSTYTITNPPLSKAGYYDVVVHNISGSVTSAPEALLTLIIPVTSTNVTTLWSIAAGTNGSYLTTSGYETRGLAYDPLSLSLLLADHSLIHVYNATNGSYLNDLNTAGFPNGGINGWTLDQIGVADDGTLYSCNLSADGTAFSIISFGTYPYGSPNYAYGGTTGGSDLKTLDAAGDRWGDTMTIRGSGLNTQILFGSYNGTVVALFTTTDGVNFTPQVISMAGAPLGFSGAGIAFGAGNTFYAKGGHNYNLRQVSFDPVAGTGTIIQSYTAGVQVPNDLTGIGVDITNGILGGVCYNDSPHDVQLYLLSGNTNSPYLFEQDFLPAANVNAQENSVVDLYGGRGFALDVNNGVIAFTYTAPTAPSVNLTTVGYAPGAVTLTWNNTFNNHNYQVQYKNHLLDPSWTNAGSSVTATNATASYLDTSLTGSTRFYRVISQ